MRESFCRFHHLILAYLLLPGIVAAHEGNDPPISVKSNLRVMQDLVEEMTGEIVVRAGLSTSDTLQFHARSQEDGWIVGTTLMGALKSKGFQVLEGDSALSHANIRLEVSSSILSVTYDDMYHDGFMGTKKVRRTVSAQLTYVARTVPAGVVLLSESQSRARADTVRVDDIAGLELPSARSTHGDLPSDSFIDKIVEPFVIIGATGVAVFLFFHVRT